MNLWGFLYLTIAISLIIHLVMRLNQPDHQLITSQPKVIKERIILIPEQPADAMRFKFTP